MKKKAVWAAAVLLAAALAAGCNNTGETEMDLNGGSTDSFSNMPAGNEESGAGGIPDGGGAPSDGAEAEEGENASTESDATSGVNTDVTEVTDNAAG